MSIMIFGEWAAFGRVVSCEWSRRVKGIASRDRWGWLMASVAFLCPGVRFIDC